MKPSYEAAEMIEDAADLIEGNLWFRGHLFWDAEFREGGNGRIYCAAIAAEDTHGELPELVREVLDLPLPPDGRSGFSALVYWNNHPDRTKQEVLDGLRLAAKRVRIRADALS